MNPASTTNNQTANNMVSESLGTYYPALSGLFDDEILSFATPCAVQNQDESSVDPSEKTVPFQAELFYESSFPRNSSNRTEYAFGRLGDGIPSPSAASRYPYSTSGGGSSLSMVPSPTYPLPIMYKDHHFQQGQSMFPIAHSDGITDARYQHHGQGSSTVSHSVQSHYDPKVQRAFRRFLMANLHLLESITDTSPKSMAVLQNSWLKDALQHYGIDPTTVNVDGIIQRLTPTVGSSFIRRESDSRRKNLKQSGTRRNFECPFRFCNGHFTRASGLQHHLSSHFRLKPQQCPHCMKYYSDSSFRRHLGHCKEA